MAPSGAILVRDLRLMTKVVRAMLRSSGRGDVIAVENGA